MQEFCSCIFYLNIILDLSLGSVEVALVFYTNGINYFIGLVI